MMAEFKKGDRVEVTFGWPIWNLKGDGAVSDLMPQDIGRKGVIEYSYKDVYEKEFGYKEGDENRLSIIFDDGNSACWYDPFQLKHID